MVQLAAVTDAKQIAQLHYSTINTGFLSRLGVGFLSALYRYLIKNEIVIVDRETNRVRGFVSCSVNADRAIRRFILNPEGVFRLVIALISRPTLLVSSIETLLIPAKHRSGQKDKSDIELPKVELLSISVDPEYQKDGTGTMLLAELEKQLRENGIKKYKVVAGSSLEGANRFYQKNGFELVTTIKIHGSEISNVYCKRL